MAGIAPKAVNWFRYFPGDYRWSAGIVSLLSGAPYGASDIGEVDRACRPLADRLGNDDAWFDAWCAEGDRVQALARSGEESGQRFSASSAYLRACSYYQVAERFRMPKDRKALDSYRGALQCFEKFARLTDRPAIERVEIPYLDGALPAYFIHAENTKRSKPPCVVFFGGLDLTREMQYIRGVPELVRRGMACLIVDGPGTGEAIRFRNYCLRADYEVAGSAALDYLLHRPDVDPSRIGMLAISLGGYYATRCAALDHRFAACVAWGAIWDYHAVWRRRIQSGFRAAMSGPGEIITWVLGVDTLEDALEKLKPFRLDGVAQEMRCPFLLTHGADDEQIPMEDAQALFQAIGSRDKSFRIFTTEEGGSQHCQRDYLTLGNTVIFDWLAEKLTQ